MKQLTEKQKAKKRVQVAEDVIEQLNQGLLDAARGVYIQYEDKDGFHRSPEYGNGNKLIKSVGKTKTCEVCAVGSLLVARARREPSFAPTDTHASLTDWFEEDVLREMESVFENSVDDEGNYRLIGLDDDELRLRAIMKNIIRHEGDFVPSDLPCPSY